MLAHASPPAPPVDTLDVFRGVAAVLMVVNHAGLALLGPSATSGAWAVAVTLGSFAPVLFFFATGFGLGLRPRRSLSELPSLAAKAGWLLLADQFLLLADGRRLGLDFFGFIAVITLTLGLISCTRRPRLWMLLACVVLLGLRFGLPSGQQFAAPSGWPWGEAVVRFAVWVQGAQEVPGVSYPLSPWWTLAALGFVVSGSDRLAPKSRDTLLAAGALLACIVGYALVSRGHPMFRWGKMSLSFLMASLAVLAVAWRLSAAFSLRWPRAGAALRLRGLASLLVVPVHQCMVGGLVLAGGAGLPVTGGAVLAVVLLPALSLVLARWGVRGLTAWRDRSPVPRSRRLWLALWSLPACAALTVLAASISHALAMLPAALGMLTVAALMHEGQQRSDPESVEPRSRAQPLD